MRHGSLAFLGAFAAMSLSWGVMVLGPSAQIGGQQQLVLDSLTGEVYPPQRPGLAQAGKEVYQANGCQYCHTQQVRARGHGVDYDRGWGKRWSVQQDYLNDSPVLLGSVRIGPDLANMGVRRPDDASKTNLNWHLVHLYNPRIVSPSSIMPPYPYLFTKRPIKNGGSPSALKLAPPYAPEAGYEIVPRDEAIALAHYMLNLQSETTIFEATPPRPPKSLGDTNTPPSTNASEVAKPATP